MPVYSPLIADRLAEIDSSIVDRPMPGFLFKIGTDALAQLMFNLDRVHSEKYLRTMPEYGVVTDWTRRQHHSNEMCAGIDCDPCMHCTVSLALRPHNDLFERRAEHALQNEYYYAGIAEGLHPADALTYAYTMTNSEISTEGFQRGLELLEYA